MRRLLPALAFSVAVALTGCSDGGPDGPSGSLTVEIAGLEEGQGDDKFDFEPDPGALGMVTRTENGYRYAQVAEGEYTSS
jgi:hypothetical protein